MSVAHSRASSIEAIASAMQPAEQQAVLDGLPLGVLILQLGPAGGIICRTTNAAFESWAGYARHEAIGLPLERIRWLAESNTLVERAGALFAGEMSGSCEIDWVVPNAPRDRHLSARLSALPSGDDSVPPRVLLALRDRTQEKQAERNLRQTMLHDALTGLPNRVLFTETVEQAVERGAAADQTIAVLILNIDRFKYINESLGHVAGDELLTALARRLLACVRGNDTLARLSGDEFAVLLSSIASAEEALLVANRFHRELAEPLHLSGQELFVTASIGLTTTLTSDRFAEELIRDADFAMHRAKALGRARTEVYQPSAHKQARHLFKLETELRRAVDRDELCLHYQPVIDLASGRITSFEALARWEHPERGMISPSEFIPLAEETGIIVPLGRWALRAACRQLVAWRDTFGMSADRIGVGVNLSGIQLARDNVVEAVTQALSETRLPGHALKIELTESAIVENPARASALLEQLKGLEATILMDDFGTGYSSLSYLQRLPIDILKIDRSFVHGMFETEDSYKIVTAILSLARSLGMRTVAEGIESGAQAERLHGLGCEFGQGFLYAKPLSAAEAGAYLARSLAV